MGKGAVVALCAVLIGGTIAAAASAGVESGKRLNTTLTLENSLPGQYEGLLSSKRAACEASRRVAVFHDENDNGLDPSDYRIGSDKSNANGEYEVHGNQAPAGDTIIAKVSRKKLKDGTVCKGKKVDAIALRS
jgi:hypothetical protein